MPSLGDLGGGLPGAAGGLAGLGRQLADAFGGLLNRPDDALPDPPELKEEPKGDDPLPDDEEPVSDEEDPEDETETETAETDDAETEEAASDGADTEEAVREEAACANGPRPIDTARSGADATAAAGADHRTQPVAEPPPPSPKRSALKPRARSPPTSYPGGTMTAAGASGQAPFPLRASHQRNIESATAGQLFDRECLAPKSLLPGNPLPGSPLPGSPLPRALRGRRRLAGSRFTKCCICSGVRTSVPGSINLGKRFNQFAV